eukprot:Hpha_TRINITY_DN15572_c0_g3::TRINITY_DN15572_c0_g3_i1::g.106448::m.106448
MVLVEVIARKLTRVVDENRSSAFIHEGMHPFAEFDCITEPSLPLYHFLKHLSRGTTNVEMLVAVVLLDRLLKKNNKLLTQYNVHRLFLAALMLAVKLQREGVMGVTKYFGRLVGQDAVELLVHQNVFLRLLDWELFVGEREFQALAVALLPDDVSERAGHVHRVRAAVRSTRALADTRP